MATKPLLLPAPRHLKFTGGTITLAVPKLIALNTSDPQVLRFCAERVRNQIDNVTSTPWQIVAGDHVPRERVGLRLNLVPGSTTSGKMLVGMPNVVSNSVAHSLSRASSIWVVLAMVYSLTFSPVSQ